VFSVRFPAAFLAGALRRWTHREGDGRSARTVVDDARAAASPGADRLGSARIGCFASLVGLLPLTLGWDVPSRDLKGGRND
jgi:hypothetical protein